MDGDGKEFMEKTRHHNLGQPDQGQKLVPPPLQLEVPVGAELVELPAAEQIVVPVMDLRKAIESRATVRKYHDEPLSMDELAYLLWCTQGVKKIIPDRVTFRNVPSAGARHPFETYILINNITGLKPGLYRYLALEHKLMIVSLEAALAEQIAQSAFNQPHIKQSAATSIWSAVIWRMKSRYGARSYRYIHLDAGHICQNLYLAAESIGSGVCAVGAFDDDSINAVLGFDGEEQFVVYMATVGKKEHA